MIITFKQVLAWFLIIVGLYIAFWDIAETYYYFTAQKEFPQVFVVQPNSSSTTSTQGSNSINDYAKQIIEDQLGQIITKESVSLLLNMSAWILFASFMLFAGAKLIGIGTGFLKES